MAEPAVRISEFSALDDLPPGARALLRGGAFATPGWFASTIAAGLPPEAAPCFQVAQMGGDVVAVLPMIRRAGRLSSLTTLYSCAWAPLVAEGMAAAAVGVALAPSWRASGVVRLEALSGDAMAAIARGTGLRVLPFDHFGNWREDVSGRDWGAYVAARPGRLRNTLARKSRLLEGGFSIVRGGAGLDAAIADYEAVYAASWKQREPFPDFNAVWMRACAADGSLRLGLLHRDGVAIAAQFWVVLDGWAGVQKLAHDEAHRALAPGTVLTGLMIRHLLDEERVRCLDFGRGDDAYKQDWVKQRVQRVGVVLANPASAAGLWEVGRHLAGRVRKKGTRRIWSASTAT